ncbi:hypothetical protein HMPREF9318_00679 [Streptococcus urinalis FB127-CNA-2]|uniref:Glycosyltransferase, group 2 family protein n=1 Tax=Streptococcus urinalis 2285-97 TaxID=764291 RepID=G5KHC1_9STRE|nr:glycosyltransferase family 2 protein [Streptococcus urinalis]EHJ57182.1 glycosyltransferase, group 2 family protein [Streptococcus urinalis 2285-97]EKS22481.1 hypothetical protein HMPREF9318_00679 [Streptococcus urinalis FB127-CNA-2]VEF32294.1 rhamnosyltransferase [Streptococcus urinalis]
MKINILMSTYNGQQFLEEQIESIQNQTFTDWTLYIRDDGSTDQTRQIINRFVKQDHRIKCINSDSDKNLGVIDNFYTLLKYDKADFYFFSDQDDIWLPEKVQLTLEAIRNQVQDKPVLVYTDLKVVDQNLNVLHESMIKTQSDHANTHLVEELTENTVTGGTMMINHALAKLWENQPNILMHDWFLAIIAAAKGELIFLQVPTELYRQHANNVLGARTLKKRMQHWIRPHQLIRKYWWLIQSSQKQASYLLEMNLDENEKTLVENYVNLLEQGLKQRMNILKRYGFRKNRQFHTFVFKTLVITKFGYRREK